MNYYQPAKRESDGRWDFTVTNDGVTHATGYCHAFIDLEGSPFPVSEAEIERHRAAREKYHTGGHATPDEARACYKTYLLDHARYDGKYQGALYPCKECGAFTDGEASVPSSAVHVPLCDEHRTREVFAKHFEANNSASSW